MSRTSSATQETEWSVFWPVWLPKVLNVELIMIMKLMMIIMIITIIVLIRIIITVTNNNSNITSN